MGGGGALVMTNQFFFPPSKKKQKNNHSLISLVNFCFLKCLTCTDASSYTKCFCFFFFFLLTVTPQHTDRHSPTLLFITFTSLPLSHLFNFSTPTLIKTKTEKIHHPNKNSSYMAFSISFSFSVVVVLVVFLSSNTDQMGFVAAGVEPMFITWQDMRVEDNFGRLKLSEKENSTTNQVIVVSKDGTGDSLTVQGAIDLVPEYNTRRVKILVLPGIYRERVVVPRTKPYVSLIANQSSSLTVISWNTKASDRDLYGHETGTFNTATVDIESDYFCATGITFENTIVAEPGETGMQAVALKIAGDKSMFFRVRVLGSQDTLLDLSGSHYFYQCYIQGAVDFIFGNARSLYQDCTLHSTARKAGAIAASHRNSIMDNTGFSFVNCRVNGTGMIYLGRAWGRYSRAIYSYCDFDGIITPAGWGDWGDPSRRGTVLFGEYQCRGKGASLGRRVPWAKSFSYKEARPFLDMNFIDGNQWLRL